MELSSPRFKAMAVTAGFSLWFFIISSATGLFSFEAFAIFVAITISITQIFAFKLSKALDIFAIINTSMNVRGEPIVNILEQAYNMIIKTDMDYIVMGNHIVKKL